MPNLLAYRVGPNPSPTMQSFDPRLHLPNFVVPVVSLVKSRKVVFALLTMWTTNTAIGAKAVTRHLRPSPQGGIRSIWLRSDITAPEIYPFECVDHLLHRNDDYLQIGWDDICSEFGIIERADGCLLLEAQVAGKCFPKP